jgi:hypothetical protein
MTDRKELINEANELGLEFAKNISTDKLQAMVDTAKGLNTTAPEMAGTEDNPAKGKGGVHGLSPQARMRGKVAKAKQAAFKKVVVTLTNKDPRENSVVTTCHLSVENQHFGVSRIVPLDVPVEIEQCLIDQAESTMMTLHKDEIKDGKRTGNKVPVSVKKFAVSYAKQKSE